MLVVVAKDMFVRFDFGCSISQGADVAAVMLRELEGIAYAIFFFCEMQCLKSVQSGFLCARKWFFCTPLLGTLCGSDLGFAPLRRLVIRSHLATCRKRIQR